MRISLNEYLQLHLKKISYVISIIVILNFIIIFFSKYYEIQKQADNFKKSVLNTLSQSILDNDIVQIKNISKGLSQANTNYELCVKYKNSLLFGQNCEDASYTEYEIPLREERLYLSTKSNFVYFEILIYSSSIFFVLILFFILRRHISKHNNLIVTDLDCLSNGDLNKIVFTEFFEAKETIQTLELFRNEKERLKIQDEITQQVAHDIRSPLSALEMVMDDIKNLPEDSRDLTLHAINRIRDIASNLTKNRNDVESSGPLFCIPSIDISNILNEKMIEYQHYSDLEITLDDQTSKCHFINMKESILSRCISNLVNNAVEALGKKGSIKVFLKKIHNKLEVRIEDNGTGFPESMINKPITRGNSLGKDDGQGLGLHYAKESIEAIGGMLSISNIEDSARNISGAVIVMSIPIASNPSWFSDTLKLSSFKRVIIIDDDKSIHDVWKKIIKVNNSKLTIKDLYTADEIEIELSGVSNDDMVLIDFDLRLENTGLAYIRKFDLKNVALVTSNYDVDNVVNYCSEHGVQLIPKQIVSAIEIV